MSDIKFTAEKTAAWRCGYMEGFMETLLDVYLSNWKTETLKLVKEDLLSADLVDQTADILETIFEQAILTVRGMKSEAEKLGKSQQVDREKAKPYFGGQILDYSAKRILNEGRIEGEDNLCLLISKLLADGRADDIQKLAEDSDIRSKLMKEYSIEELKYPYNRI